MKVFGSEFYLATIRRLGEVVGEVATLAEVLPGSRALTCLERLHRYLLVMTFGGGTNEIQRDLIAAFGLGLPRAGR